MISIVRLREGVQRCSITYIEHSCRHKRKNTTIRVNSQCIHFGFTNTNEQQRLPRSNSSSQKVNNHITIPNNIPTSDLQKLKRIAGPIPYVINQEQQRHCWYQPTTIKRKFTNNTVTVSPITYDKATIDFPIKRIETSFVTWNRHDDSCIYNIIPRIKIQKKWYSSNIPNNKMASTDNNNDNLNHIPKNSDHHEKEKDSKEVLTDTNDDSSCSKSDDNNSFQSTTINQLETNSSLSSSNHIMTSKQQTGWIEKYLPNSFQPYAKLSRIDKPIGTMLLLWPCYWSISLASTTTSLPDPSLILLFGSGAFIMRSAGCIINDLWDQTYDRQVYRTSSRPIANGDISNRNAILYLGIHLSGGLAVLLSLPNQLYCFQWGVPALLLVGIYPTMKRFFSYPQAFLGLTFNWGCFMGWAAVHGNMDYNIILPLYGSGITWTILYDTIYGHQDKKDDIKLGLYSTAITFGDSEIRQKQILYGLATATFAQWMLVGYQADILDSLYYDIGILSAYGHLLWQVNTANFNDPNNLAQRFISNNTVGGIIFASITAGKYFV